MAENTIDIYDGAGELTRRCLDDLFSENYSFLDTELTDDYLHEYPCKNFADGLTDSIIAHGYTGDRDSVEDKVKFAAAKCSENNVELNKANIRNWFTDKRPISSSRSRELVYQLCFALNFTLDEVTEFFLKVYFECPFNYRDHHEAVYYYCFAKQLKYSDAQRLIAQADKLLENHKADTPALEFTKMIGTALGKIGSEDELLAYIENNSNEFFRNNRTASKYASDLIDEACELAVKMYSIETTEHESRHLAKKANIDLLLFQLLGADILEYKGDKSFAKAADLPESVKSNFPLKMQLSNIKNGKAVSYETMRKALVILSFYCYFSALFYENRKDTSFCSLQEDFEGFIAETDDLLYSCGYPKLYIRDPFDWLIMHCAYDEFPLDEFRNAISKYYIDIIEDEF